MPLINVKVLEGVFDSAQKREVIERLTDAIVDIRGDEIRQVTVCLVEEVKSGDWGIAGSPLTTDHALTLLGGAV